MWFAMLPKVRGLFERETLYESTKCAVPGEEVRLAREQVETLGEWLHNKRKDERQLGCFGASGQESVLTTYPVITLAHPLNCVSSFSPVDRFLNVTQIDGTSAQSAMEAWWEGRGNATKQVCYRVHTRVSNVT